MTDANQQHGDSRFRFLGTQHGVNQHGQSKGILYGACSRSMAKFAASLCGPPVSGILSSPPTVARVASSKLWTRTGTHVRFKDFVFFLALTPRSRTSSSSPPAVGRSLVNTALGALSTVVPLPLSMVKLETAVICREACTLRTKEEQSTSFTQDSGGRANSSQRPNTIELGHFLMEWLTLKREHPRSCSDEMLCIMIASMLREDVAEENRDRKAKLSTVDKVVSVPYVRAGQLQRQAFEQHPGRSGRPAHRFSNQQPRTLSHWRRLQA